MYTRHSAGCCGLVEFYDLDDVTKKELAEEEERAAASFSYATTSVENLSSTIRVLRARKFKVLKRFRNRITGNMVTLWGKKLK